MPFPFKMIRAFRAGNVLTLAAGQAVLVMMVLLYISQPLFLRQLDNRIYDTLLVARPRVSPSHVPVIIDIDEASLDRYGQWPWPRYRLARLLEGLVNRGASAVALDILLAEPDRASPDTMREYLKKDLGLDIGFTGLPSSMNDYDAMLAGRLKDWPVVLGMYARFDQDAEATEASPPSVSHIARTKAGDVPATHSIHKAQSAAFPLDAFWQAAPVGLINMSPDSDGFVRQVPMLTMLGDKMYPNLGLRALMRALNTDNLVTIAGPDGLAGVKVGDFTISVSPEGNVIVPYTGPSREYSYVSAADVLDGNLPQDAFEGRILFLGTSAAGLLDIRATPFDRLYPGVEVHAQVLDAVLTGRSISIPSWTPGMQVLGIVFFGVIAALAFSLARPRVYVATGVILLGCTIWGSWFLFQQGFFFSPLYLLMTVALQAALLLMLRFWQEERQKVALRNAFSRYVAPEVVKRIAEQPGDILLGEDRELTIMFTDIRGFTTLSEQLDPRQVVALLNRYFTPMTALVRNTGGTLDKFIGDALMAFWNAPLPVPDHPVRAVEAALAMQEELRMLNESIRRDFGCVISMGAGIHTGNAYVGNMGSEELLNYTLIGDNVNLASRLEGLCSRFGIDTVVSAATAEQCESMQPGRFAFLLLDTVRVKGRQQPVSVFAAMRPEELQGREEETAEYLDALNIYGEGLFSEAEKHFARLHAAFPDRALYAVYLARTNILQKQPPVAWDGVWTLDSK